MTLRALRTEVPTTDGPRLLLISYHFPPGQSVGALRWQKFASYAATRGWGLDVLTLDPSGLASPDETRLRTLPPTVRVFGVGAPMIMMARVEQWLWRAYLTFRTFRGRLSTRAAFSTPSPPDAKVVNATIAQPAVTFRPWVARHYVRALNAWLDIDRDLAWALAAGAGALEVAVPGVHRAVISCGPPHLCHEAGRRVSLATGLPHVMDLRDPWSMPQLILESMASPVWIRRMRWYEWRAVRHAALVVMNTDAAREAMALAYPAAAERTITVMNGYDDEDIPVVDRGSAFRIAYAGTIYIDRDPRPLLQAAARVVKELNLKPSHFTVEFMGEAVSYESRALADLAADAGIAPFVRVWPTRPRGEALEFLASASVLVSLPQSAALCIPSKVFEYMLFDAWMLVLAEPESATARALQGSGADVVVPGDVAAIAAVLKAHYLSHARGERPPRLSADHRFSRSAQAVRMFDALDRIARAKSAVPDRTRGRW